MATKLITNDEQLRRYLPNAFATVKGETPFFDRMLPWLQTAERWLFSQFVGDDFADTFLTLDPDEPVRITAACVVVHEAMMRRLEKDGHATVLVAVAASCSADARGSKANRCCT